RMPLEPNRRGDLRVYLTTGEDNRPRPIPLHRVLAPWVPATSNKPAAAPAPVPELAGGSWARGRAVFFDATNGCAKCHSVQGQGGAIGPDLSNLVARDYASVMRDVTQPSFAINPDYLTYVVNLTDGRSLTGVVRSDGSKLTVGDKDGKTTTVDRSAVESL